MRPVTAPAKPPVGDAAIHRATGHGWDGWIALLDAAGARRERATLFMTLLAAFETLLWRLSGQDDLLVAVVKGPLLHHHDVLRREHLGVLQRPQHVGIPGAACEQVGKDAAIGV